MECHILACYSEIDIPVTQKLICTESIRLANVKYRNMVLKLRKAVGGRKKNSGRAVCSDAMEAYMRRQTKRYHQLYYPEETEHFSQPRVLKLSSVGTKPSWTYL